jgi:RND family efflux transporter MFP subunit
MTETAAGRPPAHRSGTLTFGLVLVVLATALIVLLLHLHRQAALRHEADRRARLIDQGPRVFVAPVQLAPGTRELTLPADVRAFLQATVYSKVAGYVRSVRVDKGDRVRRGQLLGAIASPEIDQQVAAALSDVALRRRTFERYGQLVSKDYVSRQDYETVRAQFEVSRASLRQARAQQAYEELRAPFDGVVTARYVDPGALIPAATGGTVSALPLVDVADLRQLRVTLFVQQDAAPFVREGDPVTIVEDQRPDLKIAARVSRFAHALDPRSRTMLCEIWVANDRRLYPGAFVHVTLHLAGPEVPTVPSSALLLRNDRNVVALVRGTHVSFVPVQPGRDDGKTVQILSGLHAGDLVALNVPSEVEEGGVVRPMTAKPTPQASTAAETPADPERQGQRDAWSRRP